MQHHCLRLWICHEPESFLFGFSGDVCNDKGRYFSVFNFHIQNAIIACMIIQFSRLLLDRTLATPIFFKKTYFYLICIPISLWNLVFQRSKIRERNSVTIFSINYFTIKSRPDVFSILCYLIILPVHSFLLFFISFEFLCRMLYGAEITSWQRQNCLKFGDSSSRETCVTRLNSAGIIGSVAFDARFIY